MHKGVELLWAIIVIILAIRAQDPNLRAKVPVQFPPSLCSAYQHTFITSFTLSSKKMSPLMVSIVALIVPPVSTSLYLHHYIVALIFYSTKYVLP